MSFPQHSQTRYGQCDSFFIQEEDDAFSLAERTRERARTIARVQHRQLGQELSRLVACEYQDDILDHMEFMEAETLPDVNSIDIQTEIQWYMRPYLLDFLIEAHAAFQLLPDTFFLAVNLLDRYCSRRVVYKRHYQLVGCAALLIASKYGDKKEKVPTVRELRAMCCHLYDEDMFIQMEWHVLQTLNWVIGHPTVDSFLLIALQESGCETDVELQHMTWYLCEMALFQKDFIAVRPSVLARSALALARAILGRPQSRELNWEDRYDSAVVLKLANYLSQPSQVLARKYGSITFSSVAHTVEYFLRAQQEQQLVREPVQVQVTVHEPKVEMANYGNPQTPQKSIYGTATIQHGCLTPPITPEDDQFHHGYAKPQAPPIMCPPSPTPAPNPISSSIVPSQRFEYSQYLQPYHVQ
ncbi:hypothetical protein EJ08DRAFT_10395 [Tothia fuscella]|uniref:Cyclin N-terminal domain-containing protein n=1 Tax=Tothia fuscella TaxID=1048955 RepID=A0A9P4U5I5_9PEZI|nr:hypothetical protein EJ08DRAFT_10395 [Tothia fuscella]